MIPETRTSQDMEGRLTLIFPKSETTSFIITEMNGINYRQIRGNGFLMKNLSVTKCIWEEFLAFVFYPIKRWFQLSTEDIAKMMWAVSCVP